MSGEEIPVYDNGLDNNYGKRMMDRKVKQEGLEYQRKLEAEENKKPPTVVTPKNLDFKSFSQKVRYLTKDGWELVDAVYQVFCRARDSEANSLIMESATWLADRGFGKPVQVGQLLDVEGNAVAFTLWSPATHEQTEVITLSKEEREGDTGPTRYVPPAEAVENPPVPMKDHAAIDRYKNDAYAQGPARAWGIGEPTPRPGE